MNDQTRIPTGTTFFIRFFGPLFVGNPETNHLPGTLCYHTLLPAMPQKKKPARRKPSTMDYYKANPEAYKKKIAYETKRRKLKKVKDAYNERRRFKRKKGIEGKMGNKDVSHTKSGKLVLENKITNRKRNGENGKSVKK